MYTYCKMNYGNVKLISDYADGLNEDDCVIIVYKQETENAKAIRINFNNETSSTKERTFQ